MAVSDRLATRLSRVEGVTADDIAAWIAEAEAESGLTAEENENAVLFLALAIAYETIASDAARFFNFQDGEESIDKTNIFANYLQLGKDARKDYRRQFRRIGGQMHPKRADDR
ncbi:hypothetical protein [Bacillus atrophaeus]|uniref:hypothetical protein n=1 Tax=Bacillus atrophaeus TaxID=1452 RepID=UPI002E1C74F7|nr:hypothetical protein [Bacillus atrophaeus]